MKNNSKSFSRIILICGVIICLFLHLFKIANIPSGINADEMGMGYDAWALSHFGTDRYLNTYPVYLTNYGDGQSVMYAYLCAFLLKFMDLSVVTMRLPAVILCLVSFVYGYFLFKNYDENNNTKRFWYVLIFNILPVYIMLYRYGLDCNLMLPFSWIFIYYLFKACKSEKKTHYILAGITGGLVLYTYALAHVIMPIFVFFIVIYLFYTKKIDIKKLLCFGIPLGILAAPLIMMQLINLMDWPEMHIGKITITKLYSYRIGDFSLKNLNIESIMECLKCIFLNDNDASHVIPQWGTIYIISIPFFVIGFIVAIVSIVKSIKKREFDLHMLELLWFGAVFFVGCCTKFLAVYHVNAIFISVIFFVVEGICFFSEALNKLILKTNNDGTKNYGRLIVPILIMGIYLISFFRFSVFYFGGQYADDYSMLALFEHELDEPLEYLKQTDEENENKLTYISGVFKGYMYYLEATRISPAELNALNPMKGNDYDSRMDWERQYENYIFDMPQNITFDANYIVDASEHELCSQLENEGFTKKELEFYNVYTFDIDSCQKTSGNALLKWNAGADDNNKLSVQGATQMLDNGENIVLVGYVYDETDMSCYDDVYMSIGCNTFHAELTERSDIVELTGTDSVSMCGILFIIPKEKVIGNNLAILTAFNSDKKMYEKWKIEIVE